MSEINLGFYSGVVDGALDFRENNYGKTITVNLRQFVRAYMDSAGNQKEVVNCHKFEISTSEKRANLVYDDVRVLSPGDWVHLQYELDQIHYNDKKTNEPKSFDKRTITKIVAVKAKSRQDAPVPDPPSGVPF